MEWLWKLAGFLVTIGVLVSFHEYGHFWVARRLGVKVLRYSIGFGKVLYCWRRDKDGTEYVLSAIPLGGYVKMLGEGDEDVQPEELHRAFNRKPVGVRMAIVAAGPLANFLLAAVAFWIIFLAGTPVLRPVVADVLPETPAAVAGLTPGDELIAVGGEDVRSWKQAMLALIEAGMDREQVPIQVRRAEGELATLALDLRAVTALGDQDSGYLDMVGLSPYPPQPPVIGTVAAGSAAERSGISAGDRIVSVAGEPVPDWRALVQAVAPRPEQRVAVELIDASGAARTVEVLLGAREQNGKQVGSLGVAGAPPAQGSRYPQRVELQYGPLAGVLPAVDTTWRVSRLTLKMLWKLATFQASLKHLSGPINIAHYAGESASLGLLPFIEFLALVSISLGVLNLLPIPVLDGGHLLYYGAEAIRGRPLSERAQRLGQEVGFVLLALLMAVAFYNDIARLVS